MSCVLKIYTTILNNRLMKWSEKNSVLTEPQFGFSQGVGTEDAIFFFHFNVSLRRMFWITKNYIVVCGQPDGVWLLQGILFLYKNGKSCVKYQKYYKSVQWIFQCRTRSPSGWDIVSSTFFLYTLIMLLVYHYLINMLVVYWGMQVKYGKYGNFTRVVLFKKYIWNIGIKLC